ncbi:MAG: phosphatidylinositol-specific phospholipase C [Rhodanobacter sp.]
MTDTLMPGAAVFMPTGELAANRMGYSHDPEIKTSNTDWMTGLPDSRHLNELSVPGTHDTMSFYGGDITQTQSMSLADQLKSGIRALDIRCKHIKDEFPIYHGIAFQYAYFSDVLATVIDFLKVHPSETVIMRVAEEGTGSDNNETFEQTFVTKYYQPNKAEFWQGSSDNPALSDVRGKIVVLQDFPAKDRYGIPYTTAFSIQDHWNLPSNWSLYDKWQKVKDHATAAISGSLQQGYINYLSASTGSFPYFVASGASSPQTTAPLLLTGRTTIGGWKTSWPDFPRVSCLGSWCSIAFLGTNQLFYTRLASGGELHGRAGIVMSDFPGPGLISGIIKCNVF